MGGPVFHFDFFDVCVDYGGDPTIRDGAPREIRVRIANNYRIVHGVPAYSLQANLNLRWLAPECWSILPSRLAQVFSWRVGSDPATAVFTLQTERVESQILRLAVEITIEGQPGVMLAPVTFLNGNGRP
jgi:hypothetical protein